MPSGEDRRGALTDGDRVLVAVWCAAIDYLQGRIAWSTWDHTCGAIDARLSQLGLGRN